MVLRKTVTNETKIYLNLKSGNSLLGDVNKILHNFHGKVNAMNRSGVVRGHTTVESVRIFGYMTSVENVR